MRVRLTRLPFISASVQGDYVMKPGGRDWAVGAVGGGGGGGVGRGGEVLWNKVFKKWIVKSIRSAE